MKNTNTILEEIHLPNGLEVDLHEAWRKLIQRQFGGSPGRGFAELIQNLLDSYPADVEWSARKGEIVTRKNRILITDYGEGMSRARLRLLTTLGGTDKNNDPKKIGQFGIGFFSIFNPGLGTRKVTVKTQCEGHSVKLVFTILDAEKLPDIQFKILQKSLPYSTRIDVEFDNEQAPQTCLEYAENALTYYPCSIDINGSPFVSIWEKAKQKGIKIFTTTHCSGFLDYDYWGPYVSLLRRYEKITDISLQALITGGRNMKFDLRDYSKNGTPYVKGASVTINCDNLNVTISRDSFWLDSAYNGMIKVLNEQLLKELSIQLQGSGTLGSILANQYILRDKIARFISQSVQEEVQENVPGAIKSLAQAKIYRINGRSDTYSLYDLYTMRSEGLPLFFSPGRNNLRWLGGAFKHDFIVLPPSLTNLDDYRDTPDFYQTLFQRIFADIVNLDEIEYDYEKMADLVKRDIIDKSSLSPDCKFTGVRELTKEEKKCLKKINRVLKNEELRQIIAKNLHLRVTAIEAAFFEVQKEGAVIATGLFNSEGNPLDKDFHTNFFLNEDGDERIGAPKAVFLGLQRDHEFISSLMKSNDKYMAHYMLMFLAHELAMCQKLLVPYSPYFHIVKERLAKDMRLALMNELLSDSK